MAYSKLPQIRVQVFGYLFSPSWLTTITTLMLLTLLCSLGVWQLHRAAQKRILEHEFQTRAQVLTLRELSSRPLQDIRYQTVEIEGTFDNKHIIYLDNKTYKGRHGMEVLVPIKIANESKQLLVNRGFLDVSDRYHLPVPPLVAGKSKLKGLVYLPSKPFLLKNESWDYKWPVIAQGIDIATLEKQIKTPLFSFVLLQNSPCESGLCRDWRPVNFPSYRHTGYAFQWFALGLVLFIIYIKLNTQKR